VKGQKKEEEKPIEIEGVEKWEVEKLLNKRKIFTVEGDIWKRKEDLKNAGKSWKNSKGG